MAVRIGINGFGRIGRYMTRLLATDQDVRLVAVNARAENAALVHLLKYDSVHGRLTETATATEEGFELAGQQVAVTRHPAGEWSWGDLGVDIVLETTGKFTSRDPCRQHLERGAKKVLIAAPGKDADTTIVMGVNHQHYKPDAHHIISNASCTTNCLAPVAKVVHEQFGIEHGLMTTIHSYTMSQRILDGSHKDLRRGRAAAMSMLPTTTGAAKAVTMVLPELEGRLDGMAVRVPTPNVSLVDLVVNLASDVSPEAVNLALRSAAEGPLQNILGYTEEPLVSMDFNGSIFGGVVDGPCTTVLHNRLAKLIVWYDNESGFSNQLLRLTRMVANSLG
ncbi:type I glyceraldehyde-3-phosphate dehydrogenase [Desulfonatronum thioautotrophicum]|uniref:type I glyceraldehyde-3-phosphate dehydrogenase n=1 Tax=Desulfonatronum thioautotrophicum TaxID=617001 RepID=UPI0005EBE804|nr:type I glyceraldehyde-3-phosphate dehydrogenase [Desulfonatronum thioautotrophicum]